MLEFTSGKKLAESIISDEEYRLQSVTSMKVYKELKRSKKELPSLERVNFKDFLPNSVLNRLKN